MNKVFVDSDVILDLLAHRVPHFYFSAFSGCIPKVGIILQADFCPGTNQDVCENL